MGTSKSRKETLLVAFGGNALLRKNQSGTAEEQFENLRIPIRQIARLSRGYKTIITHGNAPQVGNLLLQQERCREVPPMPLEILVAVSVSNSPFGVDIPSSFSLFCVCRNPQDSRFKST